MTPITIPIPMHTISEPPERVEKWEEQEAN